jgi:hypothetical protein
MAAAYVIYQGPHELNFNSLKGKLRDLEQGGRMGLRSDLPGFIGVRLELAQSYPTAGADAGIPQDVYDHFVMCNETIDTIDENLVIARKQVEVLEESRAFYVDARQNDIGLMVDSMKSRAQRRKDPSILAPFEKTITYNGQTGFKAAKTRRQNAAKAKAKAAESAAEKTAELDAAAKDELLAYKEALEAELQAKFNAALQEALEKKIAELKTPSAA